MWNAESYFQELLSAFSNFAESRKEVYRTHAD